ncbi:unnamed protein product [Echinostoma caproni]|uniref:Non-specific serine/threonine protein kinase n=1 Tax=Echinostoma caproni TaxID=27848 RepID=A0A183ARS5_9TREM|nr:unnamed protein product [Echinostoma caproni]
MTAHRPFFRGLSSSPPPIRAAKLFDEYGGLGDRTPQRQNSWIIRRQPLRLDSRNCGNAYGSCSDAYTTTTRTNNNNSNNDNNRCIHIHPSASDLCPARSHTDVDRCDRSIHTVALTGPTKAVSILIGGAAKSGLPQSTNPSECTRNSRDSPRHVPVSPSPRALHGLGITVDRPSISIANSANSGLQFAIHPVASSPSLVRHSVSPVTVGVSATGTVVLSRVSDNSAPVRQQIKNTPFVNVARIQRRNSTATCLPPRPRFEFEPLNNNVRNGSALVRISTTQGRGLVVTASSVRGLQFHTPSRVIRFASPPPPRENLIRPSGSCDSLLTDRLDSNSITVDPAVTQTQAVHHTVLRTNTTGTSFPGVGEVTSFVTRRPVSHIILRDSSIAALNCDMPNVPPSTVNVGVAKANCTPQTRAPVARGSMSGDRVTPSTDASGNVVRVSPITVNSPTAHKPLPPHGRTGPVEPNHGRHKTSSKQSQYFRVQLPCTRAASRSKGFVVTDSLKLYEDQILNYCQTAQQRPQSWCIDFGALNDELTLIDDSNSGSPASTVSSSYSSSSSSDASQSPSFYSRPGMKQPQHSKPGKFRFRVYDLVMVS